MTKNVLVLGGGFAGLWSAVGAARQRDELKLSPEELAITLVNRDAYHSIRVRNYERDLRDAWLPLDAVLGPVDVKLVEGDVRAIDLERRIVEVSGGDPLTYDRLVLALGSQLARPALPGMAEFGFDVDTYNAAARLAEHLQGLSRQPEREGQFTVVVVGAGLTGIETACEMPARLQSLAPAGASRRVVLVDHQSHVGSDMGASARPVIEEALRSLGIETRLGAAVTAIDVQGVNFASGERIAAATVVWCAGMRANPLAGTFPVEHDRFGRVAVDEYLRVVGVPNVFAAGDVAQLMLDGAHSSVMSCQHGRPEGRFAGHNVVRDLCALPLLPLTIDWYVTVLDLGPWGAVYTEGWDRRVVAQRAAAKRVKEVINRQRIYPPLSGNRAEILAAAEPIVQRPPQLGG